MIHTSRPINQQRGSPSGNGIDVATNIKAMKKPTKEKRRHSFSMHMIWSLCLVCVLCVGAYPVGALFLPLRHQGSLFFSLLEWWGSVGRNLARESREPLREESRESFLIV